MTDIFQEKGEKFVFIMDEWDAMFHMSFITQGDKEDYLLFLKSLLKGKVYVELAYMTGVLPIAKYSSGSELNGFLEFDMAGSKRFGTCFGFTESETDMLYQKYRKLQQASGQALGVTRNALKDWYDGYDTASGVRIYNPRSVVYIIFISPICE